MIRGIGPDEPTETNEQGGTQSALAYRFDLLPARALFDIAQVLHEGEQRHGAHNWRKIATADHLNHALAHVYAHLDGDEQDAHLSHAACRLLFAMETARAAAHDPLQGEAQPIDEMGWLRAENRRLAARCAELAQWLRGDVMVRERIA